MGEKGEGAKNDDGDDDGDAADDTAKVDGRARTHSLTHSLTGAEEGGAVAAAQDSIRMDGRTGKGRRADKRAPHTKPAAAAAAAKG